MRLLPGRGILPALLIILLFVTCKKEEVISTPAPPVSAVNMPPVARAGADQVLLLPLDSVILDGSASSDPEDKITAFGWKKIRGSSMLQMLHADSAIVKVTGLWQGVYEFELTVRDKQGSPSKDTVQVSVLGSTAPVACGDTRQQIAAALAPAGTLTIARTGTAIAFAGNKVVFAGGSNGGWEDYEDYTRVDILDVATNTWSVHELSRPRSSALTAVSGNKIFIAGGYSGWERTNAVDVYDAATGVWTTLMLPNQAGKGYMDVAAAAGGKVLFVSGAGSQGNSPYKAYTIVDIYDVGRNTWRTDTLHSRTNPDFSDVGIAATVIGTRIYLAGNASIWQSYSGGTASRTIDMYDAATDSWTTSTLKYPRGFMGAIAVGSKNFWAGGVSEQGGTWSDVVEIRDMTTGTSSFSCLSNKNAFFSVVQKGNQVVFFTSTISNEISNSNPPWNMVPDYPRNTFDIYDLTTGTWSIGVLPKVMRGAHLVSANNTIYVLEVYEDMRLGTFSNKVYKLEF